MDHFEPGSKAVTPLANRYDETQDAIIHLITDRGYNRAIVNKLRFYTPSELPSLPPLKCPGYYRNPEGVGERGAALEVTYQKPLDVPMKWNESTVTVAGRMNLKDQVLIMNVFDAGEELQIGGKYFLGTRRGSQEELCYRTSFTSTFPPEAEESEMDDHGLTYSARVVIVRESFENGHAWYELSRPESLHVVSVASVRTNPKPAPTNTPPTPFWQHLGLRRREESVQKLSSSSWSSSPPKVGLELAWL